MGSPRVVYGIPLEWDIQVTEYAPDDFGVAYKKYSSIAWVDIGEEFLVPHQYVAWKERRGGVGPFVGPVQTFDIPPGVVNQWVPIRTETWSGEVARAEPALIVTDDDEPEEEPLEPVEIEAAEFEDPMDSDPPTPPESDPEELPSSEWSEVDEE